MPQLRSVQVFMRHGAAFQLPVGFVTLSEAFGMNPADGGIGVTHDPDNQGHQAIRSL
jgi:hypothetical protein